VGGQTVWRCQRKEVISIARRRALADDPLGFQGDLEEDNMKRFAE